MKTKSYEIKGNLLLSVPEFFFKVILLFLCAGLAVSLEPTLNDPCTNPQACVGLHSSTPILIQIVTGAIVGVIAVFVVNFLSTIAIRIWGKKIYSPEMMKHLVPKNQLEWLLILIPLLLSVTVEELLFRGLLVGGMQLLVNPWVMAVASSLLFGLMHSPQGTLGIILTTLVGMGFAALFIITNSLLPVITAHFVINLLQIMRAEEDLAWYDRFEQRTSQRMLDEADEIEEGEAEEIEISTGATKIV